MSFEDKGDSRNSINQVRNEVFSVGKAIMETKDFKCLSINMKNRDVGKGDARAAVDAVKVNVVQATKRKKFK